MSEQTLLAGLTPAERQALVPMTVFSDAIGESLKRKGMMVERDGVWFHTKLGERAWRAWKALSPSLESPQP